MSGEWADPLAPEVAVVHEVEQYVITLGPYPSLPEGIRLEIHPAVNHALLRNWMPGYPLASVGGPLPPQIPVRVNAELGPGEWRLVAVTETVIRNGKL